MNKVTRLHFRSVSETLWIILIVIFPMVSMGQTTTSPDTKPFSLDADKNGNAVNSVNLLSGDVSLPMTLVSLTGRNGLDASVSIAYNSNVSNVVDTWNREAPAGILGLGWTMELPRIVCNNRLTGTREDDEYYLVEGGASNRLVRTKSGSDAGGSFYEYEPKSYQFWKVKYYYDAAEVSGSGSGSNKWEIVREDGTKYIYGDKNSSRNTIQYVVRWDNWIGNSAQTSGQTRLANVWNLSEIVGLWGDKITFEYEVIENFVGSNAGQKQTEASYIKQITDPIGRKIQFYYLEKQAQFFVEPHTEQPNEPDAYQEFYERKYLDRIEVLEELGNKYMSLHFGYGTLMDGTSFAKMLLTSIEQRNGSGIALPQLKFEYINSGFAKGHLQTITYPTGGKLTYEYTQKVVGRSARELEINAPAGFSEPMVWTADDYIVVAWRQMGAGWTHDSAAKDVKLYVYQWVGEWKEQFLGTIPLVPLPNNVTVAPIYMYYGDFQVVTESNFFAVSSKLSGNTYSFRGFHKDASQRGVWQQVSQSIDVGTGQPQLLSGYNFVALAPFQDDATHPCITFTYNGSGFVQSSINQTVGDHYYTASNNYFISQNRAGFDGQPDFSFNYLSEDKKWYSKNWLTALEFSSDQPSYWYSSDGMAMVMADDNPEYAYRWDLTYTNFFRDSKDVNNNDLFGLLNDEQFVSIINNSFIAAKGRLARYDGKYWYTGSITSTSNSPFGFYFSYGEDIAVRPIATVGGLGYKGGRKVFDPNTLQWLADFEITSLQYQKDVSYVGIDYYYFGNSYYYRQPNGSWSSPIPFTYEPTTFGGYPRFEIWPEVFPNINCRVTSFRNGSLSQVSVPGYTSFTRSVLLKAKSEGTGSFVLYANPGGSYSADARTYAVKLKLFRQEPDAFQGKRTDNVVSVVTVASYDKTQSTYIDYNASKAVLDPTGAIAMYNEVTVIPGSASIASKPTGYTKTFFHVGATAMELYASNFSTDLRWVGMPYDIQIYDASGTLISTSTTNYTSYTKNLTNSTGTVVDVGYYVRPTNVVQVADGITTTTNTSYDVNTGLPTQTSVSGPVSQTTYFKYFSEAYDPSRTRNILTPVILTRIYKNSQYIEAKATRYKTWTATNNPNGVPAPYDEFIWKGSGTSDFSSWDITLTPNTDWIFASRASVREPLSGVSLERQGVAGRVSSLIANASLNQIVGECLNAGTIDVGFTSFEDLSQASITWSDGVIANDPSGRSKTGVKFMNLGTGGLLKTGLNASETYKVSFWVKTGGASAGVAVDGATTSPYNSSDWAYQEYTVTGRTSIGIRRTSGTVSIDEVRIHPTKAFMSTSAYHIVNGVVSTCNANNQVAYYEYDEWGRSKNSFDDKGNLVNTRSYYYKN